MRKRTRVIMGAITAFSILLAGCTGSQGQKKRMKHRIRGTRQSFYPNREPIHWFKRNHFEGDGAGNPLVENFETNDFTKWYEEKTNVHIEWEVVPSRACRRS